MDIQNVFIIIGKGWNKRKIVDELKMEGYKHNFFFCDGQSFEAAEKNILLTNEVWCFGECDRMYWYQYAKDKGLSIWLMG